LRNGPNPGNGRRRRDEWRGLVREACAGSAGSGSEDRRLRGLHEPADALKFCERLEGPEEVARDGDVIAEVHLPALGGHKHEADSDRVVRVQMFRAVLDDLLRVGTLSRGGDVQNAGLDAA
jgi:hypothetical protein